VTKQRCAFLVVDLGFGDAGKGLITDSLVRRYGAELVVRFNGGAQAGHNVVTAEGQHHTFSQFSSGSFALAVRTHLARDVVVHPTALLVEAEHLARAGVSDALRRISIDPACRVTTPFQQAANRVRELLRGEARHGSCGVGFGETVRDSLVAPELTVHFGDLREPERVRERVFAQRALKLHEFAAIIAGSVDAELRHELRALLDPELANRWLELASRVAREVRSVGDEIVGSEPGSIVFEGAQGVLLDERFGFHPFTTHSRTNFDGALDVLARSGFAGAVQRIGVLRAHAVRHGPGPLPTEDTSVSARTSEPHNQTGPWQQHVRKGWPDLVLLRYALLACAGADSLAVTHLDTLSAFDDYRYCHEYRGLAELQLPTGIGEQEVLTRELSAAEPLYRSLGSAQPAEFCGLLQEQCGIPVRLTSHGRTAQDVSIF